MDGNAYIPSLADITSQQLCGIPKVNMSAWGTYPYAMPSGCNGGYYA